MIYRPNFLDLYEIESCWQRIWLRYPTAGQQTNTWHYSSFFSQNLVPEPFYGEILMGEVSKELQFPENSNIAMLTGSVVLEKKILVLQIISDVTADL